MRVANSPCLETKFSASPNLTGDGMAEGKASSGARDLRRQLRAAGLSGQAIDAAWPAWWEDEADASPSARAELRFALARNLGLSAQSLVGERVDFVWNDTARFKHLGDCSQREKAAINSFGVSVGRALLSASPAGHGLVGVGAAEIRAAIVAGRGVVDLLGLLSTCWSLGVPVAHLRVSPLATKSMHAMVTGYKQRHAILLSRDASYAAITAFTLAHEIGHIALGHLQGADVLVDAEEPHNTDDNDRDEIEADRYALELLLGTSEPDIRINFATFNSLELAEVVVRTGPQYAIEPGTLALAVAYRRNAYPVAMAALRHIYGEPSSVWRSINRVAAREISLEATDDDSAEFLTRVLGLADA